MYAAGFPRRDGTHGYGQRPACAEGAFLVGIFQCEFLRHAVPRLLYRRTRQQALLALAGRQQFRADQRADGTVEVRRAGQDVRRAHVLLGFDELRDGRHQRSVTVQRGRPDAHGMGLHAKGRCAYQQRRCELDGPDGHETRSAGRVRRLLPLQFVVALAEIRLHRG